MSQEIKFEALSPLHIGGSDGADLVSEELVFDGHTAYVVDIDDYFDDNPDEVDEFVREVERGGDVSDFFGVDVAEEYAKYVLEQPPGLRVSGNILGFIKGGMGEPYVPGSSIKGCIRTALATRAVKESDERDWLRERDSHSAHRSLERDIFRLDRDDPKYDMMKAFHVRDAEITEGEGLYLDKMKTYSLRENGDMEPKFWDTHAEFLSPGTRLRTEIVVDTRLLGRMVNEGPPDSEEKARTIFGDDLSDEESIVSAVEERLSEFASDVLERDEQLSWQFDAVDEFHGRLRERISDGYALRMGFSTGWHSNTVGTAFSGNEEDEVRRRFADEVGSKITHKDCGGDVVNDDRNGGRYFCRKCTTGNLTSEDVRSAIFPKTRNFVVRRGRPEYPLGWVAGV